MRNEEIFKQNFKKKLREIRIERGLNRTAAAKKIGVAISTLQAWEDERNDRMPSAWDTQRLIATYNLSLDDLFEGKRAVVVNGKRIEDPQGTPVDPYNYVYIPRYDVQASAGHGSCIQNEKLIHHLAFRKDWINELDASAKDLVVINVAGDSMNGEINDGDIILINSSDKYLNNGIYVIRISGDLIVKRIQKMPGNQIQVISANKEYQSYFIDLNEPPSDFECIGRVVWHGRDVP